jgi:hypothetical protein
MSFVVELEPEVVEGAFAEFQLSSGGPEEIVPNLCVVLHESNKFFHSGLDFQFEVVGSVGCVVDEA